MASVKCGDFVRYTGDIEDLVRFIEIDDQDMVRNILKNSSIVVSDILSDGQIEIEARVNDAIHFFYISDIDIRKIS